MLKMIYVKLGVKAVVVEYKTIFGVTFITGFSIGIEFPHMSQQLFTCAIDLGIIRFVFVRQLITN